MIGLSKQRGGNYHRSPFSNALTDPLLGAFALTDNLKGQAQELVAEPANDPIHPSLVTFRASQRDLVRLVCNGIVRLYLTDHL
ncbi:hypothetical protein AB3R30_04620 [Leptolyngbyaceae cyanobacterium UHCC 1019]